MRPAPDDEFKLRFPVAKDRTLRRISVIQAVIIATLFVSLFLVLVLGNIGLYLNGGDRKAGINNLIGNIGLTFFFIFILMFPAAWIMSIVESIVLTRRYGWRAVSDPIEAQRIAMREALYDVATGSTRADVEPEREGQGDRIMIVPVRRLRPIGARLELTAEREKERASRETRPTQ